jgi:CubicO group peptidase (beta-lactamase class C family)
MSAVTRPAEVAGGPSHEPGPAEALSVGDAWWNGSMVAFDGEVAPGFEPVREAFLANFEHGGDVGAAVCVYLDGRPVVDLWGGSADTRPWQRDTLQLVYSATKGATAACAHLLAERGELDLEAPVAECWPEFAAEGKEAIPVRQLLSHRAGLPVIDRTLPVADVLRWDPMIEALAAQRPVWAPGTAHGYHGRTFGWLVGEVVRRVSGRTPGRFFADEIAKPFGIDWHIGLPASERDRVGRLVDDPPGEAALPMPIEQIPEEFRAVVEAAGDPDSLMNRAFGFTEEAIDFNDPAVQDAEMPASNGICTARGLARFYAGLIGEVDGARILEPETVAGAVAEQSSGIDQVLLMPTRFGSGFMLPSDIGPMGGPESFGHPGRGGSLGFADPSGGVAFGFVVNRIRQDPGDTRAAELIAALHTALT